ncbi:CKLF-like MARVEL transmembrane domain-containing protein 1 [Phacochoerus africanus]|uniref:CKLF-like MARVEL transmembrane domain-containing protein 1 n=1 Tax=Phacochoerus africanus TaxID=41426 RepID=UPI001FD9DAEA|nr:CKLF-like MARVEL transmembrane domain-containing protein 1 [Phacochoerus africanus]
MAGWGRRGRLVHPSASVHPTGSASRPPSASRLKAARKPEPPSEREKAAIQKRAEGRAKVPPRFRDSVQRFFLSPTGLLKIIRLGLLLGALVCFISVEAQESYIAVTILEICIDVLFILMYMLTLHRLMTYLHWPLLDLINSFITTVFLLVVAALAMQEKERRHLFYVGGTLCLTAAIVCLIDATVVTKTMRKNMKKALGIETEANPPWTSKPNPTAKVPKRGGPNAPTRTTVKLHSWSGVRAPSQAGGSRTWKAPSRAASISPSLHSNQ